MHTNNIFAVRQYEDRVELYCNGIYYGYDILEYFSLDNPEFVHTLRLSGDIPFITVSELEAGRYNFACYDKDYTSDGELELMISGDSLEKHIEKIVPEKYRKIVMENKKKFAGKTFLTDLYDLYLSRNWNSDDTSELLGALESVIDNHNNMNQYMNGADNAYIAISKKNVLIITSADYTEDYEIEIFRAELSTKYSSDKKVEWKLHSLNTFDGKAFTEKLPEGLYKINILKDSDLVRQFYFLGDNEDLSYEKYSELLSEQEYKAKERRSSLSVLPSYFEYESEKEMNVLISLEAATDKHALFERPRLYYLDGMITAELDEIYLFLEACNGHDFFLCGIEEDEIYKQKPVQIKVKISRPKLNFNPWEYFFRTKPYYFYIADENNIKITRTTYLDLTEIVYSDDEADVEDETEAPTDITDYNETYQKILWQQYVKKLHTLMTEHHKDLWSTTSETLNDFILTEGFAYKDITYWLSDRIMKNWNQRFQSISWGIYYANLCKYNSYADKDRNFMHTQKSKPLYRTHIIPAGEYVLAITRYYIDQPQKTEYIYSNNTAIEFRFDEADYTLFRCIDINNGYKISDFGMYCNTSYDTIDYKFNSLEVEILQGL